MGARRPVRAAAWVAALVVLVAGPWLLGTYERYVLCLALVNVILAVGLNLLTGNAGQVSLCHSSFMAIGAYACTSLYARLSLPYWLALPAGGLSAALFGYAVGLPALRLRGYYLALATLGFLEITQILIQRFPAITGGAAGMQAPRPDLLGLPVRSDLGFYYVILCVAWLLVYVGHNLLRSRVGRAFAAIRVSEPAAGAVGISVSRAKVLAFALAAFYAGIAGGLYAPLVGFVDPVEFGLAASIAHVTFIVVGGLGSLAGSIIGAVVLTTLPEWLRGLKEYREFVYGGLLLAFLVLMPEGLVGIRRRLERSALRRGGLAGRGPVT